MAHHSGAVNQWRRDRWAIIPGADPAKAPSAGKPAQAVATAVPIPSTATMALAWLEIFGISAGVKAAGQLIGDRLRSGRWLSRTLRTNVPSSPHPVIRATSGEISDYRVGFEKDIANAFVQVLQSRAAFGVCGLPLGSSQEQGSPAGPSTSRMRSRKAGWVAGETTTPSPRTDQSSDQTVSAVAHTHASPERELIRETGAQGGDGDEGQPRSSRAPELGSRGTGHDPQFPEDGAVVTRP